MKIKFFGNIVILSLLSFIGFGCGEGTIDVNESKYEPKIVVDGYIYPDKKVENIRLTRNFPLNKDIDVSQVILSGADASITDLGSGRVYKLVYNPVNFSYEYPGTDLQIGHSKSYKLDVTAVIDGITLHTSSTTTVPQQGFNLLNNDLGSMNYREKDNDGNIKRFNIQFTPSSGTDFYAVSVTALDAAVNTFIYDNAFFTDIDSVDLVDDFDNFRQSYEWMQNTKDNAAVANYNVEWYLLWFYGNYKIVLYAGDKNFKDFLLTHKDVKEMDGNFHEPKLHLEGDGIGVFGSAIVDTAYFSILKP